MSALTTAGPDCLADLGHEVQEVLDRRKQGLLQAGGMGEEERTGVVTQLMALVARLEEELFQSEARRFEAEVTLQAQQKAALPSTALMLNIGWNSTLG